MPTHRIRFLYQNRYAATTTTLTASSASTALPVAASQNPDRNYVFRSGTVSGDVTIDIDLGSVLSIEAVAIANLRLFSGGAVKLYQRGDLGSPGASTLVATLSAQDTTRATAFAVFSAQSHRHWRITFANTLAVSDYVEAGYIFLGPVLEPSINVMVPASTGLQTDSQVDRAPSGARSVVRHPWYDTLAFTFQQAPTSDVVALDAMAKTVGAGTPLFVLLDETLAWTCWLAFLASKVGRRFELAYGRHTIDLAFEEAVNMGVTS